MNKKILSVFVLVLTLSFTTKALASLTFTSNTITGTTPSTIDLGTGNTLSLQTTTNAPITIGTGLVTLGGSLNVSGNVVVTGKLKALNFFNDEDISGNNYGIGSSAFNRNDLGDGTDNIAIGSGTLYVNTSGWGNIAIGTQALTANTTGRANTAVGYLALHASNLGRYSTAVGFSALYSSTAINTFNVAVGYNAGYYSGAMGVSDNAVTTGTGLTFVGFQSGLGSATQRTNSTAIGNGAYVDADNTVVLGNGAVTEVKMGSTGAATVTAGSVTSTQFKLSALNTAPANATVACTTGEIRIATGYIYVCVATNSWQRSAMASW